MFIDWVDVAFKSFIALVIGLFILIVVGSIMETANTERLYKQCLLDHKEYECYSMIKKHNSDSTTMIMMK